MNLLRQIYKMATDSIYGFTDLYKVIKEMPEAYSSRPSAEQLFALNTDYIVKVGRNGEWFWVDLIEVTPGYLQGTVANDLGVMYNGELHQKNPDLKYGDTITFDRNSIREMKLK